MKTVIALCIAILAGWTSGVRATEWVAFPYATPSGVSGTVQALVRKPADGASGQAMVLLHHAGGFDTGTTTQYAELFQQKGFTTLELKMFDNPGRRPSPSVIYAMVAAALRHLSEQPDIRADRISAVGLSLGASLTVNATSKWFYEHHRLGNLRFHRLAALYPVCWIMSEALRGRVDGIPFFDWMPSDYLQSFAGVPLLILAAGRDGYNGLDPQSCPDFVKAIPDEGQARRTQVKVYPEATHGWDHGRTYEFNVVGACAGRTNCRNRNVSSPETVARGKDDLIAFFLAP
jgi:dienelactone hydrolase